MKNSTLLFRSLFFVILIAGSAHLVTYASKTRANGANSIENRVFLETSLEKNETGSRSEEKPTSSEKDDLTGTWKVNYNMEDFNGAILYKMKKEGGNYNAYIIEYQDEDGYGQEAENTKALTITSFDGYKGQGEYRVTYEGKTYNTDCTIEMVNMNVFKLSYDFYGYSDVETWKKQ
ncbi:MAG: hypothetical protein AAF489_11190 [Bacteroidota bacterium]